MKKKVQYFTLCLSALNKLQSIPTWKFKWDVYSIFEYLFCYLKLIIYYDIYIGKY